MSPDRKWARAEGSEAALSMATEWGDVRSRGWKNPTDQYEDHGKRTRTSKTPCGTPGLVRHRSKGSSSRDSKGVLLTSALLSAALQIPDPPTLRLLSSSRLRLGWATYGNGTLALIKLCDHRQILKLSELQKINYGAQGLCANVILFDLKQVAQQF